MKTPLAYAIFYGVLFLLLSGPGNWVKAQNSLPQSYLQKWDEDGNKSISHVEFYKGMCSTEFFERWDSQADGRLDRQEVYDGWERIQSLISGSASIENRKEFVRLSMVNYAPYQQNLAKIFQEADLNRNESLNKAEFYTFIFRFLDEDENGLLSYLEADYSRLIVFSGGVIFN